MNQGKLEVVKQEMARVNVDILGISELKWTGMGNLTQMTTIPTTVEWSSHHGQQKSPKCGTWMQSQKQQNDLSSFPTQTIQYHSNPSLCPNQECWRTWSWTVLWRPTRPFRTNTPKRCPFHYRGLECQSRKSRNTWGNRQISEKAMAPHSSTLAWKIPWTEEPVRLQSMGSLRVGHDWATSLSLFTFIHWRRKWQPTPVFLPGESQGRRSLVGCRLWGRTESDTTEVT